MTFNPMITKLVLEGHDEKLPDAIRIGAEEDAGLYHESQKVNR